MKKIQTYRTALRRAGVLRVADVQAMCSQQAQTVLHEFLRDAPAERIAVVYLDGQNNVLGVECVAMGGGSTCGAAPSEVFRGAIVACARAVIVGHNHPSGDPSPSNEDLVATRELVKAGAVLGIPVLDHIIVTRGGPYTSLLGYTPGLFQ